MKKILLVKTSSLGDVIHNLPVASDIRAFLPDARVEWVVEEAYAAIPRLHPGVARVLPVAIRRWRSTLLTAAAREEVAAFVRELRQQPYDAVIDTQGLLKSALVARLARGFRHGLDFASAREPLACFYDCTYAVPWTRHAVERNRALAASALGYAPPALVTYGIAAPETALPWLPDGPYAVLVHATSARAKLWPDGHWAELGSALEKRGARSVLIWGTDAERRRAETIAARIRGAVVAPRLPLDGAATLLGRARAVIGVDTGLTHLAVALQVATVGLYCATDPAATGLYGGTRAVNLGGIGAAPKAGEALAALERLGA